MTDERECPERDCATSLPVAVLVAHLIWDHNRSEFKARQMLGVGG